MLLLLQVFMLLHNITERTHTAAAYTVVWAGVLLLTLTWTSLQHATGILQRWHVNLEELGLENCASSGVASAALLPLESSLQGRLVAT